ncbi:MAG: hypothetical protein ACM3KD_12945 [Hyphomicrobiaceae bacterium]
MMSSILRNRYPTAGHAPGAPGIAPSWTSSDKDLVGTAIGPSRLWFTLGHGIVNEVYYPRIDIPQIRDLGFIVADDAGFWVEVKRGGDYTLTVPAPGVPLPRITHRHPRFVLSLRLCPDATRDVLLIDLALEAEPNLRVYVLLAPHLGGTGRDNRAEAMMHRGQGVLWARQGPFGLALLARTADGEDAMGAASAGYVGASDGWQDFAANGRMSWHYAEAGPGNVALMAEVAPRATLALGLATSKHAAATLARTALMQPFSRVHDQQAAAWRTGTRCASRPRRRTTCRPRCVRSSPARRRCSKPTATRPFRGQWWQACRSRGAIAAKNVAVTIWSGRAIWSSRRRRCWLWAA